MLLVLSVWTVVAPAVGTTPKFIFVELKVHTDEIEAFTTKVDEAVSARAGCAIKNVARIARAHLNLLVKYIIIIPEL